MQLTETFDETVLAMIQNLYQEAFPPEERKPFALILQKRAEGAMRIHAILNGEDVFQGMAMVILYKDMALLDYFAIQPQMQGNGAGSKALCLLRKEYGTKRFFLEIERTGVPAANAVQRQKRKAFYLKNGLVQTSLLVELFGVEMEVLADACEICFEEYYRLYAETFGETRMGRHIRRLENDP